MSSFSSFTRVLYASRWSDPDRSDVDEMLADIVGASIRNNSRIGVTGLLLFRHGWFLQVLEGDLDAVDEVFDRIRRDPRHMDVRTVADEIADKRAFADWNMTATPLEVLSAQTLADLGLEGAFDPAMLTPQTALALMVAAGQAERRLEAQPQADQRTG